jgi:hypothetical protein
MVAPGNGPGPENEGIVVIMRQRPARAPLAAVGGISTQTHDAISAFVDDSGRGFSRTPPALPVAARCRWRLRMRWR